MVAILWAMLFHGFVGMFPVPGNEVWCYGIQRHSVRIRALWIPLD